MKKNLILCTILLSLFNINVFAESSEVGYYALFLNGSRCGYAVDSRQIDGDRVINTETIHFKMERMGTPIVLDMEESSIETADGKPLGFKTEQRIAAMVMNEEGEIFPDGTMKIVSTNAGNRIETTLNYPEGALMSEGMSLMMKKQGLKTGTTYSADVFIPSMKQGLNTSIEIGEKKEIELLGRTVELLEVKTEQEMPGGGTIKSTEYFDKNYKAQKAIVPIAGMNIEMVACSESFAKNELEAFDLFVSMFLKSPKSIQDLPDINKITYILKPKNPDMKLSFPSTDHQKYEILEDGSIQLTVSTIPDNMDAPFPYKGNAPKILEFLEETSFIQSSHPDIISLAEKCTKGKKSAMEAALAIEAFVSEYIERKDLSVGYASALEVVKSRQGDCTEHALLVAALCRAVGIPSRVAGGVAYMENIKGRPGTFMGHAWAEAYIGEKWRGLDAAMKELGGGYNVGRITTVMSNGNPTDLYNASAGPGEFTIQDINGIEKQGKALAVESIAPDSNPEQDVSGGQLKNLIRAELKKMLATTYEAFAEEQNLSPETKNSLVDLLVGKRLENLDMALKNGNNSPEDVKKKTEWIEKTYDEKISELLSPEDLNAYKEYSKVEAERGLITEFKAINYVEDNRIDKEKEKELIAAMFKEREHLTEMQKDNQRSMNLQKALSKEVINKNVQFQNELYDRYLESAREILSDSQMKSFGSFIDAKKSMLEMSAKLAPQILGITEQEKDYKPSQNKSNTP